MLHFNEIVTFILIANCVHLSFEFVLNNSTHNDSLRAKRSIGIGGFSLEVYHQFEEIIDFMKKLGKHYKNAEYVEIGRTSDDLPVSVIEIKTPNVVQDGKAKPIVMIECGIHAREWISSSTCLWIMNDLLKNKSPLLAKFDFHLLPVLNPEGYVFSWTRMRSWRKNRSKNPSLKSDCYGIDLNRNFDADFCNSGASKHPCDVDYCGDSPFSEIESRILRDYVLQFKHNLAAYFSLHNFGQFWMYPYAYTLKPASNFDQLTNLAKMAVDAIHKETKQIYEYGPVSKLIYESSGSSIDWIYDNTDCKIVFIVELRDKGVHGFRLPDKFIKPTATEVWTGIQVVLNNI